jgi:hypothetical protein
MSDNDLAAFQSVFGADVIAACHDDGTVSFNVPKASGKSLLLTTPLDLPNFDAKKRYIENEIKKANQWLR